MSCRGLSVKKNLPKLTLINLFLRTTYYAIYNTSFHHSCWQFLIQLMPQKRPPLSESPSYNICIGACSESVVNIAIQVAAYKKAAA